MYGYAGNLLFVDLSSATVRRQKVDEELARGFLGGNGFVIKLLADRLADGLAGGPADEPAGKPDPGVDAFDEHNSIVFAVGPLTDTPVWGSSRFHLGAVSPLTGLFADSSAGGDFGYLLKRSGCDALVVTGRSAEPVYLEIRDGGCLTRDARSLWGWDTAQTIAALKQAEAGRAECVAIGPGGENLVRFAGLVGSGRRPGTSGRCGLGAVMGSKKLKAVVARAPAGSGATRSARPQEVRRLLREWLPGVREGNPGGKPPRHATLVPRSSGFR